MVPSHDRASRQTRRSAPPRTQTKMKSRLITRSIDAILPRNGVLESVIEELRFGPHEDWLPYTRGYIMENPWGGGRWVCFLFGYDDAPAEARQFDRLAEARSWGKR